MRLGAYPCRSTPGSKAEAAYETELIFERHRHRYEVNPRFRRKLEDAGLVCSGESPDGTLVEIIELADHPVVRRRPVPSRVQEPAGPPAPAVP